MCADIELERVVDRPGRAARLATDGATIAVGAVLAVCLLKDSGSPWDTLFAVLWWIATVVVIRSDLEYFIIPDGASFSIAGLGLAYAFVQPMNAGLGWGDGLTEAATAAIHGLSGFAVFWLVALCYCRLRGRHGLGFGDVKLAGALAIWLNPSDAALALQTAALAGIAVLLRRRRRARDHAEAALPFGAFMAPAAWFAFVAGPMLRGLMDKLG